MNIITIGRTYDSRTVNHPYNCIIESTQWRNAKSQAKNRITLKEPEKTHLCENVEHEKFGDFVQEQYSHFDAEAVPDQQKLQIYT